MARNQKNFGYLTYVDDSGSSWNKRGEIGGAATAVDGNAPAGAHPVWIEKRTNRVRTITYMDSTTGRTIRPIFYTAAAYAAVTLGSTLAVQVTGDTATVNYTAIQKNGEKRRGAPNFSNHLAD